MFFPTLNPRTPANPSPAVPQHSSTTVVNNQTFLDWFIHDYMFNAVGSSPLVSGFFWDDCAWCKRSPLARGRQAPGDVSPHPSPLSPMRAIRAAPSPTCRTDWPGPSGDFPDSRKGIVNDTGMTTADLISITDSYNANMAALENFTIANAKFSWQMLWTGGPPEGKGSTCPEPLVSNTSCALDLQVLCTPTSPAQTRTLMYAFGPGACRTDPSNLVQFEQDLANFLLVRGPYAYLGHGWLGCSRDYEYPAALNVDYGVPTGLCAETAPGSGVFVRDFTKSTVQMDCNTWTPTITMK